MAALQSSIKVKLLISQQNKPRYRYANSRQRGFRFCQKPHYKAQQDAASMFKGLRNCTKEISENVPLLAQIVLWNLLTGGDVKT